MNGIHSSVVLLLPGEQEEGLRGGWAPSRLDYSGNAIGRQCAPEDLSRAVPVITLSEGAREGSLLGDAGVVFEHPG